MFLMIRNNSICKQMLLVVIFFIFSINAYSAGGKCYRAIITEPVPFNGNGGEIIILDNGTIWKESSYQYLYLYEYNPSVIICPSKGTMHLNDYTFFITKVRWNKTLGPRGLVNAIVCF